MIALGTNNGADDNPTFAGRVNTVLDAIYPTGDEPDRVYWVNMAALNPANATYARLNPVLASTLAGRPEGNRITLLDWHTHIHSPGIFDVDDWLPADIPHMTAQGYAKRDAFIAEAVRPGLVATPLPCTSWTATGTSGPPPSRSGSTMWSTPRM
ncbi:MAG: SGNH/GDSL hydrolase family protein [Nocardioidaceae bacterium]|nr:MAG: SGNH/GDSL hydrolase family protein [Nocardioidaceae bacterium]